MQNSSFQKCMMVIQPQYDTHNIHTSGYVRPSASKARTQYHHRRRSPSMSTATRPTLGPMMSLTCFQYLRSGAEEVAERAPVVAAGRKRGAELVDQLGLRNSTTDGAKIASLLDAALGVDGTRLCLVKSISETV